MYDLWVAEGFADASYEFEFDKRTEAEWVKAVSFSSKRSGYYQRIEFEGPSSIDSLVYALVTAKAEAASMTSTYADATVQAVRDANHTEEVGERDEKDGLYRCPWCCEPIPDEPKRGIRYCPACGLKMTGFEIG